MPEDHLKLYYNGHKCHLSVTITTYEAKPGGARNYRRTAYCYYCRIKSMSNIAKHLRVCHPEEPDIKQALVHPSGSKERHAVVRKVINEGNFVHNCEVGPF